MSEHAWGTLEINLPGKPGTAYRLTRSVVSLGADTRNDIALNAAGVSAFHCKIVCDEKGCEIIGLRSESGVSVNQRPAVFKKLVDGDIISMGSVNLKYCEQERSSSPPPQVREEAPEAISELVRKNAPYVRIHSGAPTQIFYLEPGRVTVMGTDRECQLVLPYGKKVFPRHASIEWASNAFYIRKLYEPASVLVNDTEVRQHHILKDGNIIRLGDIVLEYGEPSRKPQQQEAGTGDHSTHISTKTQLPQKTVETIPEHVLTSETVSIGRDPSNTIVLNHVMISRFHAKIEFRHNSYYVTDPGSTNGTFLNGSMINDSILTPGDLIQIGDFEFLFDGKSLRQTSCEGDARIDAINLTRTAGENLVILNDISLSIQPRELVAIVGGSGTGKSTLMNALAGFSPADSGTVLVNGIDYYKYFDAFRSSLGYVPQDDIIHKELSVFNALYYAACLRMPEDTRREEREARILQILSDLQLEHRRDTPIIQLSGGERRRVSIGVELLTRPRILFLDEPTSGLDPRLEAEMMNIFRTLANQGHTTILITHATKNLHLCDQVVFLVKGGQLAYFGPPGDALTYFNAADFSDIYVTLEKEKRPDLWVRQYRNSSLYKTYVQARIQESQKEGKIEDKTPAREKSKKQSGGTRVSVGRQFFLLSRRYIEIIYRDTRNLAILLLQAPLIGILLSLAYGKDIFNPSEGSYGDAKSLLFFLICICIWFGTSNAAREIAKEIPIYRRERFINLGIAPYIFSKVAVLCLLCIIQTAILLFIVVIKISFSYKAVAGDPSACKAFFDSAMYQKCFFAMLITSICSMTMGLMLSSITGNPDKAASIVPILLIPQIVFSGAIIPLKGAAEFVSYFTLSRWGFELLGNITHAMKITFITKPMFIDPNMLKKLSGEAIFDILPGTHWMILIGYLTLFILAACLFQKLKDYQRIR